MKRQMFARSFFPRFPSFSLIPFLVVLGIGCSGGSSGEGDQDEDGDEDGGEDGAGGSHLGSGGQMGAGGWLPDATGGFGSGGLGSGGFGTGGFGSGGFGTGGGEGQGLGVQVYILFGQSNMWGEPNPEPQDMVENPNVEVLTLTACGSHQADEWVTAQPPLHSCVGQVGTGDVGPGVGPGDYFGRTVAAAYPSDTILLIPNAIPGVSITEFAVGGATYNKMIARAEKGQERGQIRGILFHQGESDCGSPSWPGQVQTIVDAMRDELEIGDVPFLAGEIPYTSQCQGHNTRVQSLPGVIDEAYVISAEGLGITDDYHFGLTDQRTFGTRYGEKMLELLP